MANNQSTSAISENLQSLSLGSEDVAVLLCQPCQLDNKQQPAYGYCQTCSEHLCEECYTIHTRPAPLRGHVLLDKSQMPQSTGPGRSKIDTCVVHDGKAIEYLCMKHNIFGCSQCVTLNHRSCNLVNINEVAENFQLSDEFQNIVRRIGTVKSTCMSVNETVKENMQKTQQTRERIRNEIQIFRKQINSKINQWEKDLYEENDHKHDTENVKSTSTLAMSRDILQKTQQLEDNLTRHHVAGNNAMLYIQVTKDHSNLNDLEKRTAILKKEANKVESYEFRQCTDIVNMKTSGIGRIIGDHSNINDLAKRTAILKKEANKVESYEFRQCTDIVNMKTSGIGRIIGIGGLGFFYPKNQ